MIKKTITYEDFNGNTVSEDFFFHLSKADLVELEVSHTGGLSGWIKRVTESNDGAQIIAEFKKLLLMSYGKKSEDGKRFIRNAEMRDEFFSSEAYSTLFMELVTDAKAAAEFVNGIVPAGLQQDVNMMISEDKDVVTDFKPRVLTSTEMMGMNYDELKHLLATGQAVLG